MAIGRAVDSVRVQITGDRELAKAFEKLDDRLTRNTLLRVQRKAMTPVVQKARTLTPKAKKPSRMRKLKTADDRYEKAGNLAKSIKKFTGRSREFPNIQVGFDTGTDKKYDGFYGHLVAQGVAGKRRSKAGARPSIQPAWEANKEKGAKLIMDTIWSEVKKNW